MSRMGRAEVLVANTQCLGKNSSACLITLEYIWFSSRRKGSLYFQNKFAVYTTQGTYYKSSLVKALLSFPREPCRLSRDSLVDFSLVTKSVIDEQPHMVHTARG